MLDLPAFRAAFPEFRTLDDSFVQTALDSAALRTGADVLGDLADEYHGNRAADIIVSRPSGGSAKQKPTGELNVYAQQCKYLEALVSGFRGELP